MNAPSTTPLSSGPHALGAGPEFSALVLLLDELSREAVHGELPRALWESALYRPLLDFTAHTGKELRARLTRQAFALGGGTGEPPALLPLLCELLHAGSLIVDDIEDGSLQRRGRPALHVTAGLPLALNAGNFLYFVPFALIERLPISAQSQLAMHRSMGKTLVDCHRGQALDLHVRVGQIAPRELPAVVAKTTELKTGALVAMAASLGALAAEASQTRAALLAELGSALGSGLQMWDDLGGLTQEARASKGLEDLRLQRATWPWAWACALLNDAELRSLQLCARRASRDEAAAWTLRLRLRELIEEHGRAHARAHLQRALARFEAAVGDDPTLREIEHDLVNLERSYA